MLPRYMLSPLTLVTFKGVEGYPRLQINRVRSWTFIDLTLYNISCQNIDGEVNPLSLYHCIEFYCNQTHILHHDLLIVVVLIKEGFFCLKK